MINHIHFKMRNFIFIILLSVVCSCSQQNNDDIVVDFNVQNMTYSKIAIVVSPEMIKETDLDKHGKASCTLQGNMIYARLFYGEEAKNVFFQKGDHNQIVSCKHLLPAEETRETRKTYVKAAENDHFGSRAPRRTGKSCRPSESPRERSSLGVRSGPEEYL